MSPSLITGRGAFGTKVSGYWFWRHWRRMELDCHNEDFDNLGHWVALEQKEHTIET